MNTQSPQNEVALITTLNQRETEVRDIMGTSVEDLEKAIVKVEDEDTRNRITTLAVDVTTKLKQLKGAREKYYDPARKVVDALRAIFDTPGKRGKLLVENGMTKVNEYNEKVRREAELKRQEAEAESKRKHEEAERLAREAAEAEAKAKEEAEARKKAEDEARQREEDENRRREEAKAQAEAEARQKAKDEHDRKVKEEEDQRIKLAEEAKRVGIEEKVDAILDTPKPIADAPAPVVPTKTPEQIKAEEEAAAEEQRKKDEEQKRIDDAKAREAEEATKARKAREAAEKAEAAAKESEMAVAASKNISESQDSRTKSNVRWNYKIGGVEEFKQVVKAAAMMCDKDPSVLEYLGFNPKKPDEFRASKIGTDVTDMKATFQFPGIQAFPVGKLAVKALDVTAETEKEVTT